MGRGAATSMRALLRASMYGLSTCLVLVAAGVVLYDQLWLAPRLAQLRARVEPARASVPAHVADMIRASASHGLEVPIWRMLAGQTAPDYRPGSTTEWNLAFFTGATLLRWRLREEELIRLYACCVYVGMDAYGLEAASKAIFDKPLTELDRDQAAEVAAVPVHPQAFLFDAERRRRYAQMLRSRAEGTALPARE